MMVKTKIIDGVNHILHQNDWTKPHLVNFAGKVIELNYGNDLFIQLMQINNDGSLSLVKNAESASCCIVYGDPVGFTVKNGHPIS